MNIHGAIISSTAVLQTFQCKDFAQFVRKTGRRSIDTTGKPSAQYLLSQIAQYFEPFQDEATVAPTAAGTPTPASTTSSEVGEGSSTTTTSQLGTVQGPMPVKIYKKAQLCVANLHTRFSTKYVLVSILFFFPYCPHDFVLMNFFFYCNRVFDTTPSSISLPLSSI